MLNSSQTFTKLQVKKWSVDGSGWGEASAAHSVEGQGMEVEGTPRQYSRQPAGSRWFWRLGGKETGLLRSAEWSHLGRDEGIHVESSGPSQARLKYRTELGSTQLEPTQQPLPFPCGQNRHTGLLCWWPMVRSVLDGDSVHTHTPLLI